MGLKMAFEKGDLSNSGLSLDW